MAQKVSQSPDFPYITLLTPELRGVAFQLNSALNRLQQEVIALAVRANLALPEDGSEPMTGPLVGTSGSFTSLLLRGATSGTVTVLPQAIASGTVNVPNGPDTLVGRASTDTLTNKTITSSTNSLGGVTTAFGSDATGDIYYNNANILTRLPIGSATNVLTVASGKPSWAAPAAPPAQNFSFLGNVAVSGGTLTDTTLLGSGSFRSYELVFKDLIPVNNPVTLSLQVHSGGVYQTTTYLTHTEGGHGSTGSGSSVLTTGIPLTNFAMSNTAPGLCGFAIVSALSGTSTPKPWTCHTSYVAGSTSDAATALTSGFWNGGNGAIDGFQIIASSGALTSGSVDIYGLL